MNLAPIAPCFFQLFPRNAPVLIGPIRIRTCVLPPNPLTFRTTHSVWEVDPPLSPFLMTALSSTSSLVDTRLIIDACIQRISPSSWGIYWRWGLYHKNCIVLWRIGLRWGSQSLHHSSDLGWTCHLLCSMRFLCTTCLYESSCTPSVLPPDWHILSLRRYKRYYSHIPKLMIPFCAFLRYRWNLLYRDRSHRPRGWIR